MTALAALAIIAAALAWQTTRCRATSTVRRATFAGTPGRYATCTRHRHHHGTCRAPIAAAATGAAAPGRTIHTYWQPTRRPRL